MRDHEVFLLRPQNDISLIHVGHYTIELTWISYFPSELSSINTCSKDLLMTQTYRSKFWADHSILTARCTQIITVLIPYTTPTYHHRSWRACMVKISLETTYWAISYHLEMRKFVYLRFRNRTFCHIFATELFFLRWQK